MTARDFMTPDPILVQTNDDPREVMAIFLQKKITALPVADGSGEIIGMLSEMGLVKIMVQFAVEGKGKKIGSYTKMFDTIVSVKETDALGAVAKAMVSTPTHRVLVRNGLGKVIGIVSPKDLLRVLSGGNASTQATSTQ